MRWRRTRWSKVAAAGGIVALAVNAAAPVILAFLLAAALAPAQHDWVRLGDGEWHFYGPLCRHDDAGGAADEHGKSHAAPCPVCSLHGALAIALPAPAATPSDRVAVAAPAELPKAAGEPAVVLSVGYRSRAPPLA
jgi:hypothetical protein